MCHKYICPHYQGLPAYLTLAFEKVTLYQLIHPSFFPTTRQGYECSFGPFQISIVYLKSCFHSMLIYWIDCYYFPSHPWIPGARPGWLRGLTNFCLHCVHQCFDAIDRVSVHSKSLSYHFCLWAWNSFTQNGKFFSRSELLLLGVSFVLKLVLA